MAKVSGGAAFQMLRKPDNIVNDTIQQNIQTFEKRRAEGDARKEADKAGIKKDYDTYITNLVGTDINGFMTGDGDINKVTTAHAMGVRDKVYEENEKARQAYLNGDTATANKHKLNAKRAESSIKAWNDYMTKVDATLTERIKNPNAFNPNDKSYDILKSLTKGDFVPKVQEDGTSKILVRIKKDLNGDGVIGEDEFEEVDFMNPLSEAIAGQRNVDLFSADGKGGGALDAEKSLIGKYISEEAKNGRLISSSGFDFKNDKDVQLLNAVRTKMVDDALVAKILNNAPQQEDRTTQTKGFTDEQKEKAAKIAMDMIIATYQEENKNLLDMDAEKVKQNAIGNAQWEKELAEKKRQFNEGNKLDWYNATKPSKGDGKELTEEEMNYARRLYDIQMLQEKGDVSMISGSYTNNAGVVREIVGKPRIINGRMVIDYGKNGVKQGTDYLDIKNPMILNEFLNSVQDTKYDHEKVLGSIPVAYGGTRTGRISKVKEILGKKGSGIFDDDEVVSELKKLYPEVSEQIENDTFSIDKIKIGDSSYSVGSEASFDEIEKKLSSMVGGSKSTPKTTAGVKDSKYGMFD